VALPGDTAAPAAVTVPHQSRLQPALVWLGLLAGTLLVAYAYANAATEFTGQAHYHFFWLGVLIFLIPAFLRLCSGQAGRAERLAIVAAVGLFNYLPKFLRTPQSPLFHDELAHWRQAELIYKTGRLFLPDPTVYISQYFPGLHTLTVALRYLTGLSTFQVATVILAVLHLVGLVGVFVLAERITHSSRTAAIAAFIYSLNPSFMYFDSEYSYESVAIIFFIWVLVAAVQMQAVASHRRQQLAWGGVGLILAASCIVTHHLTSYTMVLALLLLTAVTAIRAMRGVESWVNVLATGLFTAAVTVGALAWLIFVAPEVIPYLTSPITTASDELSRIFLHKQASRTLFSQSTTPAYEHWSAFASLALAALGATLGMWRLRQESPRSSARLALSLFGLLYFASLPLMLTGAGQEGARRSWAFSYLGLSILIAPALAWLLHWMAARRARRARSGGGIGIAALLGVVLVGNVSMHTNELYRFPGPYVYGSDTRSTTAELLGTGRWFSATQGTNRNVVTDRYDGLVLSSFAFEWTSQAAYSFPVWELYFRNNLPSAFLLHELQSSDWRYMIVDQRMSQYLPHLSVYFERDEPDAVIRTRPLSPEALKKFEHLPWTIKIYQSDNLSIYRFNFAALHVPWKAHSGGTRRTNVQKR
jgi:hypothetical protein